MHFPTVFSELITYNMIPVAALTAISFAPHISDGVADNAMYKAKREGLGVCRL